METVDILKAARERITDPEKWTRGAYARDSQGNAVSIVADDAAAWCLLGACIVEGARDLVLTHLDAASYASLSAGPSTVNDNFGHHSALWVLDYAIWREKNPDRGYQQYLDETEFEIPEGT